ncbi:hypothetical protein GSI_06225 [Ganoderma sinense ZZ0214-1]|uniref:Protein CPL1-like domain-containing protein n=1 Tax=Ganoderma sinense ZZ0214-1 TaxID=1077348 RepID=A0A2G8SCQ2_9APHY|nr:hypothetical protein GSI_06225 [Ganoderma sinense ZZ0214-1]
MNMGLLFKLLPLVALGGSSVVARTTPTTLRQRATTTDVLATDLCGDVSAEFTIPGLFGTTIPLGHLDLCYCESQIPLLLTTDPLVISAVLLAGVATTKKELVDLLNSSKNHETCYYPDHAEPVCAKGAPCSFKCKDGFTPEPKEWPTDCVCKPPFKVCNGLCGHFKACPSGKPHRRESSIRKRSACGSGMTACGIYGRANGIGSAWECINTTTDLESCGGCAIPLDDSSPDGVDCTAIPGVVDVACRAGSCVVNRCIPGYEISTDGTFCLASHGILEQS